MKHFLKDVQHRLDIRGEGLVSEHTKKWSNMIHDPTCMNINIHIYIYMYRKGHCQAPIFPRFWKCSVFATSCSVIYVHIHVMILLIYTDCQTSSEVAKECPESHEGLQGKGRRKNKHSVCIHIWLPLGERWHRTKKKSSLSPLLALLCIALLYTFMDLHFSW